MAQRPRTSRCAAHLLTFLLALSGCIGSLETSEVRQDQQPRQLQQHDGRRRHLTDSSSAEVGGYKTISDLDSDNSTARVVAQYVVQHLDDVDQNQQSLDLGSDVVALAMAPNGNVTVDVVRGYSQVVAGTNYRLLLALMSTYIGSLQGCLGAFAVEVYVRWDGQTSITDWGRIVDCDAALQLKDDPTLEYGPFNADFQVNESIDDRLQGQDVQQGSSTSGSGSRGGSQSPLRGPIWFLQATMVGCGVLAMGVLIL